MKVFCQRNFDMLKMLWQPQLFFTFQENPVNLCQTQRVGVFENTGYSKNKLEMIVLYTSKNHTDWEQCSFSDAKVLPF